MVSKIELRKICKAKRIKIKNKKEKEKIITEKILNHEKVINSKNILIYISLDLEVSTMDIINNLLKINKNIFVPKVFGENIKFYQINSLTDLQLSNLNIFEPITNKEYINDGVSVCIVPGLLFDKNNNRLGYGGGYYDRFLNQNKIYKIGICFNEFLVDKIDVQEHDIKMDEVITEV